MTTEQQPTRKWRRWAWIILAIMFGVPACTLFILKIVFISHAIPKDQLQPASAMLKIKPATTALKATIDPPDQRNMPWEQYLEASQLVYIAIGKAKNPASESLHIYEKWRPFVNEFGPKKFGDLFGKWRLDQPLNAEQTKWLLEHQDFIKDMVRMAKTGGMPSVTCEEAAAMKDEEIAKLGRCHPWGNYYIVFQIFAAESRRLRDVGDPAGAAEMILAINPLAESIGEPFYGCQIAEMGEKTRGLAAIENWVQTSMPPEIAKKLRDDLASWHPIDLRRGWEIEYRSERYEAIAMLNRPAWDIFKSCSQAQDKNVYEIFTDFTTSPMNSFRNYSYGMLRSIELKSSADASIQGLDRFYRDVIDHSAPDADLGWPEKISSDIKAGKYSIYVLARVPNLDTSWRQAIFQSRVNMDLTALDQIAKSEAAPVTRTDPFNHGQPFKKIDEPAATALYSIGPDRKDDRATLTYDATNGTLSGGDIFVRIPKNK